jgi:hypothetical protein
MGLLFSRRTISGLLRICLADPSSKLACRLWHSCRVIRSVNAHHRRVWRRDVVRPAQTFSSTDWRWRETQPSNRLRRGEGEVATKPLDRYQGPCCHSNQTANFLRHSNICHDARLLAHRNYGHLESARLASAVPLWPSQVRSKVSGHSHPCAYSVAPTTHDALERSS